ncbi:MAG TPA: hypothetical protein VFZ66_10805 [Herpetosiphonaceae bacterium]
MRFLGTSKLRRLVLLLGVVAAMVLLGATPALAAERRSGDQVVIGSEQVIADDLYVTAGVVRIDGTIEGDLIAAASQITINGTVEGDVLAVAQAIVINGTVGDDLRVGGAVVQFGPNAQLADDALAGAASIEQQAGGTIGGDAYLFGSQALLAGTTHGSLEGGFAALELRGTIDRDVNVAVGSSDGTMMVAPFTPGVGVATPAVRSGLTVDESARIGGKLNYTATDEFRIPAAQVGEGIEFTPVAQTQPAPYAWLIDPIRRYVTLFVIGLLLLWIVPNWVGRLATTVRARPMASLGWGTLSFVGAIALMLLIPLSVILLMVLFGYLTLGGLAGITFVLGTAAFSALLTSFAVLVSYIVQIVVGLMIGRWLLGAISPQWAESRVGSLALGLALYVILRAVPYLGVLVALIVTLLGLGAVWQWVRVRLSRGAPTVAPMPVA